LTSRNELIYNCPISGESSGVGGSLASSTSPSWVNVMKKKYISSIRNNTVTIYLYHADKFGPYH
jgi:hypothetical protein